jgi:hypothetical protein
LVLDVASDYLRFKGEKDEKKDPDVKMYRERNLQILTERSRLHVPSEPLAIRPFTEQPDAGHQTSRVTVGAGWRNNDTFEEASIRGAYHDLLDPGTGYTPDAQIELGAVVLRHYNRAEQARLERVTLVNIVSLSPIDELFQAPSWKVNVGMQTIRHNGCQLCSNGVINIGAGGSVETQLFKREVYFAFAEAEGNYSAAYEERHRVGGGGTVGMLADVTDRVVQLLRSEPNGFTATADWLRIDPTPGKNKSLLIRYRLRQKEKFFMVTGGNRASFAALIAGDASN